MTPGQYYYSNCYCPVLLPYYCTVAAETGISVPLFGEESSNDELQALLALAARLSRHVASCHVASLRAGLMLMIYRAGRRG